MFPQSCVSFTPRLFKQFFSWINNIFISTIRSTMETRLQNIRDCNYKRYDIDQDYFRKYFYKVHEEERPSNGPYNFQRLFNFRLLLTFEFL